MNKEFDIVSGKCQKCGFSPSSQEEYEKHLSTHESIMKSFRFYIDIDAENEEAAREDLIEQMVAYPLVDMPVEEIPSHQMTYEEAQKIFGFKDRYDLYEAIQNHFGDYDAWLCRHCLHSVGNDSKEMLDHLMTHTREELKKTDDGDDFEEEDEEE